MTDQITSIIGALVRHGLNAIGGGLVANGVITGGQLETVGGALTIVIVTAWSVWQKKRTVAK